MKLCYLFLKLHSDTKQNRINASPVLLLNSFSKFLTVATSQTEKPFLRDVNSIQLMRDGTAVDREDRLAAEDQKDLLSEKYLERLNPASNRVRLKVGKRVSYLKNVLATSPIEVSVAFSDTKGVPSTQTMDDYYLKSF